jgi:long-chain acyl-CoA synthetase
MNATRWPLAAGRRWTERYPTGVPATHPPAFRDGLELFAHGVRERPDAPALHYFDATLTHAEADAAAHELAAGLRAAGVGPGDRVALYLQNVPAFVVSLHAAWLVGAAAVPVNPMLKPRELHHHLADCGARLVVCLESLAETVEQARPGTAVERVVTTSELEFLDAVPNALRAARRIDAPGAVRLADLLREHAGERVDVPAVDPSSPALLCYTSGSTGPPKGAILTHGCLTAAEAYHRSAGVDEHDVVLGAAPLFHLTGLTGHIAIARHCAVPLVLFHRFDAGECLRMIERWRATFAIAALTAYIALLDHPDLARRDISSLSKAFTGGAPVSPAVVARFERATGRTLHPVYGMTETTGATHITPLGMRAPVDPATGALSVGLPVSNVISTVVDVETGERELAPGEVGEIVVAGPGIVPGYWNQPSETAHALRGGFMHTGDIGAADADGWFYLLDRAKDMIVASGFKVWPREVEDVLYEHPSVGEAAVVGVPDDYRGETIKAFVSLRPDAAAVVPAELIEHCREHLAAYKCPRSVEILDELPKTASGKLLRRRLAEPALRLAEAE